MKTTHERPATIASGMTDLFGEPDLPEGFRYIPGVLSRTEEASFVQRFEKLSLKPFEFHAIWASAAYSPSGINTCLRAKSAVPTPASPIILGP